MKVVFFIAVLYTTIEICVTIRGTSGVFTHHDPDVIDRLPRDVRDAIDIMIANKLTTMTSLHFQDEGGLLDTQLVEYTPLHYRMRRDVNNTGNNTDDSSDVSQWSAFDECTERCGGGYQVRIRDCLATNCSNYVMSETRQCGLLPCVAGTYSVRDYSIKQSIPLKDVKSMKFFNIGEMNFFGYITAEKMILMTFDQLENQFTVYQQIVCEEGVSFDIMNTHRTYFLVVLEKRANIFNTKSSVMYYFDMMNRIFKTDNPVRFDVTEPSAVHTFDVFGIPFIGVVNSKSTIESNVYERPANNFICDKQNASISCPDNKIISIVSGFYGRISSHRACNKDTDGINPYTYCVVPRVKDVLMQACDGKQTCTISAERNRYDATGLSSRDCSESSKLYIKVEYKCIRMSYRSEPKFYRWDGIGLALVSGEKLVTYNAKDIQPFTIHNQQYIAVANHNNDLNSYHIDSEIYVYNVLLARFSSLQRLRTDGAVDFEFFTVGKGLAKEYFLAVANYVKVLPNGEKVFEVESVIYKWNWNVFVPFQCLMTNGAKKWTAITGLNGEFLLSMINKYGNATFYAYDGWRFHKTKQQPNGDIFDGAESMVAFIEKGQPMFLVENTRNVSGDGRNIYQVNFMKTYPKYELFENTVQVIQELNRTVYEKTLPRAQLFNQSYERTKNDIVFTDTDSNITVFKSFKSIDVVTNTVVDNGTIQSVDLSPIEKKYEEMQDSIRETIDVNSNVINATEQLLLFAFTISTEQVITGMQSFYGNLSVQKLTANGNVNVNQTINNIILSEVVRNALFISEDASILGEILFNDDISFYSNVLVNGRINDVLFTDVILTDTDSIITGQKTFKTINFEHENETGIRINGFINGKDTSNMLLKYVQQNISGNFMFENNVEFKRDIHIAKTVNQYNISALVDNSVLYNEDINITSRKQFTKASFKKDLKIRELAVINSVDVSELTGQVVDMNALGGNNDTVTFKANVDFLGNLDILGNINDVDASDYAFTTSPALITGSKTFLQNIDVQNNVEIGGKINGVDIPEDVMRVFGNQTVSSIKRFNSTVNFNDHFESEGLFDRTNISKLHQDSLLMATNQEITGYKVIKNLNSKNITVKNCTYDCELLTTLSNLQMNAVKRDASVVTVQGVKMFDVNLTVTRDLTANGKINDEQLPGTFMINNITQNISGVNLFQKDVVVNSNAMLTLINNINIDELFNERITYNNDNIVFKNDITFSKQTSFKEDVVAKGSVDNLTIPDDIVLSNANETISGQKKFTTVAHVDHLSVFSMTADQLIDGVNITLLDEQLVRTTGNTVVEGTKMFQNHVSFAGNWTIPGLIDGVNITELNSNAMRLDGYQVVSGTKTFSSDVTITNDVTVKELIDNTNLTKIEASAVYTERPNQVLTGQFFIENAQVDGDITVHEVNGNITVNGLINNIEIESLARDTLMVLGDQTIAGLYQIETMVVDNNLNSTGKVNNVSFHEELIYINAPSKIKGEKTFSRSVNANNVNVRYLINDLNISNINERVVHLDQDATFSALTYRFRKNVSMLANLTINEDVNGIQLHQLLNSTLMKTGNQIVEGLIYFDDVVFSNNVTSAELLNELNIRVFEENIIYKCHGPNRPITSNVSFNDVTVIELVQAKDVNVQGNVNGIDFDALVPSIVTVNGTHKISGVKMVSDNLQVNKIIVTKLNEFKFHNDFVSLDGNDTILSAKVFRDNINISEELKMANNKTINGIDLSEYYLYSMMSLSESNDELLSAVTFMDEVNVSDDVDVVTINSVNISLLLMRRSEQNITSAKVFTNNVHTMQEVKTQNDINGFDLDKLQNELLLSDRNNTIGGMKMIVGNVTIREHLETNLLDDKNVTTLFSEFTKLSDFDGGLSLYESSITTHTNMIKQILSSLDEIHPKIHFFVQFQDIPLPYQSHSMDVILVGNDVILVAGALKSSDGLSCTDSFMYKQTFNETFNYTSKFVGNSITGIKLVKDGSAVTIMTSSSRKNGGCLPTLDDDNVYNIQYRFEENSDNIYQTSYFESSQFKAKGIEISTNQSEVIGVITNNDFNSTSQSNCAEQQVFSYKNNKSTILSTVNACNVVKDIVISANSSIISLAVLVSSSDEQYLEIIDISQGNTYVIRQSISTYYASDVMTFTIDNRRYLVIVNTFDTGSSALVTSYTVPSTVMRLNDEGMYEEYQDINITGAILVKHFNVGTYSYLAFATLNQQIVIYKHKGINKWQKERTIPIKGYASIKDLHFWVTKESQLFMAVLSTTTDDDFPSKIKIVKAEMSTQVGGASLAMEINKQNIF